MIFNHLFLYSGSDLSVFAGLIYHNFYRSTIVGTTMSSQVATVQQLCGHLCSDIPSSSSSGLETLEMTIAQMAGWYISMDCYIFYACLAFCLFIRA